MAIRHVMTGAALMILSGCAGPRQESSATHLHAYDGPIASRHAGLVVEVTQGSGLDTGVMSYRPPDGETCKGRWQLISGKFGEMKTTMPNRGERHTINEDGGISSGGTGSGTFVSHGKKGSLGEGHGTCSDGATFEFAFKSNGHQARGALKDSHGNIFRMVLR
jgi:hypothetical protein